MGMNAYWVFDFGEYISYFMSLSSTYLNACMLFFVEMQKGEVKLSPAMSEIVKTVQQCKWTLMRTRQQLSRGYKEVPILLISFIF